MVYTWPVRVTWSSRFGNWRILGRTHYFHVVDIKTLGGETGEGCMPGYAQTFSQTLHLGPVKVIYGPSRCGVDLHWLLLGLCTVIAAGALLLRR